MCKILQSHIRLIFILLLNGIVLLSFGQDRYKQIDSLLTAKSASIPALDEKVSISVSDVSLEEFLRAVANSSGLNLDVEPGLNYKVINNFSDVKVRDMLVFVCRQFDLDLVVMGNIISVVKVRQDEFAGSEAVIWDENSQRVTLDFSGTPADQAIREITRKTRTNVILAPGASGRTISGYIDSQPLGNALQKLAFANGFELENTEDGFYILEPKPEPVPEMETPVRERSTRGGRQRTVSSGSNQFTLEITRVEEGKYNIYAENAPIPDIMKEFSQESGISYFLSPNIEQAVTLQVTNQTVDGVLNSLFSGSEIGYKKSKEIYLIGERNKFDFNDHRVIQLQNRSTEKILEILPEDITTNLNIVEFVELNSLMVSGPEFQVETFSQFIRDMDKVVPVVMIEVIILSVSKSYAVATGIEAGLAQEPVSTGGKVFPGFDMQIGASEINRILNDMGWINLGQVSPNFYVSLQALEEQGMVDVQSTPKLATLNGHEATLSIGNTEYYLEEQTHLYGTQNPQQTTSQEYKAIEAELSVKIKPVVSADEQITLEVEVRQSDFTERISKTAPPGSVNREFTSLIRVKNQEMILLGGLEEKRKSDSGSGTPILSRIPLIKWIFSSRKREDSQSKLSVLIKPTIVN